MSFSDSMNDTNSGTTGRLLDATLMFGVFVIATSIVCLKSLVALAYYAVHNDSGSHLLLMPLVIGYLFFTERQKIFSSARTSRGIGLCLMVPGAVIYWAAMRHILDWPGNTWLSAAALAFALILVGGFVCCYGVAAARTAVFPLCLLTLIVPVPDKALEWIIRLLQQGSTEVAYLLFNAVGVPVLRNGFDLSVPTLTIEVASECSGIRSSIALFITCLLAAHLYLRTFWKKVVFVLLVFPFAVLKNGVRVVTLTLLAVYVDPGFLHGSLHRDGGFVFFGLALLMLFPFLVALGRSDQVRITRVQRLPAGEIAAD
jgi:exosortase